MATNIAQNKTTDLTAAGVNTDDVEVHQWFNLSISGTFVATVTIQRTFDGGSNYVDVEEFTTTVEKRGYEGEKGVFYRAIIKVGNYTSGTAIVRISQ